MADPTGVQAALAGYVRQVDAELTAKDKRIAALEAELAGEVPTPGPTPTPPGPSGWKLQYETTFTSLAGWTAYDGQTQGNDNSVNLAKNAVCVAGRGLVLRGRRESGYSRPFTSAEVVGKGPGQVLPNYFRAEVVGTFKDEPGVWPCLLWFRPNNSSVGEIDVMEWMGGMWTGTQKRVAVTMHNEYGSTQDSSKKPLILATNPWYDPAVEHTYVVEKVPGSITVRIDNRWSVKFTAADKPWWNRVMEVQSRTWYSRITLQIGAGANVRVVPDPPSSWSSTEMSVRSLRFWTPA